MSGGRLGVEADPAVPVAAAIGDRTTGGTHARNAASSGRANRPPGAPRRIRRQAEVFAGFVGHTDCTRSTRRVSRLPHREQPCCGGYAPSGISASTSFASIDSDSCHPR